MSVMDFHHLVGVVFGLALLFVWLRVEVLRLSNADVIQAVVVELGKAKDEIVARIASLEAAAVAGEDLSGPLADLQAAADALDAVVPDVVPVDAPVDVPVEPV